MADSAADRAALVGELEETIREHTTEMLWLAGAGLLGGLFAGHIVVIAASLLAMVSVVAFRRFSHRLLGAALGAGLLWAAAVIGLGSGWQAAQANVVAGWIEAVYCGLIAVQGTIALVASVRLNRLLEASSPAGASQRRAV